MFKMLSDFVDSQEWLDRLGGPLQGWINGWYSSRGNSGKQIKDALNGTWLGHPLHPMLTDVPVGAWTCTFMFDTLEAVTRKESLRPAADLSLAAGLAVGVGAAASGFTDWSDTYGRDRKVGLLHGLTMGGTVVLYSLSLGLRLAGARRSGVICADLGYGLLSAGAYLGGDEVYDVGYGVKRTAFETPPAEFVPVIPASDLQPNRPIRVDAGGTPVMLVKQDEQIYALGDTCTHAGCSLAGGQLEGHSIVCPCHASQFDLRNGAVIHGPATMPEPAYDTRILDEMVEVRARR